MIEKLASNLAHFYSVKNVIENTDEDTYVYGFEVLISTALNILSVIIVSLLFGSTVWAIAYMLSFVVIRISGGGYHAKTHKGCILAFSGVFLCFAILSKYLETHFIPTYALICTLISSIAIWRAAPVEATNKPLSDQKKSRLRIQSLIVACCYMALALSVVWIPGFQTQAMRFVFSGELAAAVSIAVAAGDIRRRSGSHVI
jgi:accessory gene regulator B